MRTCTVFLVLFTAVLWLAAPAYADVPRRLNFQAILLDSVEGVVPDGTYELVFRIFPTATGGTELWSETQSLATQNGLFNTFLGVQSPVPDSVFSGPDRWLEIQLTDNSLPYEPRGKIGSVAYSYRVGSVDAATGGSIIGDVIIEGNEGSIGLYPDEPGNASVQLPNDAVSSPEILDEPGIAQGMRPGDFDLTGAISMTEIVVCTIVTPAPGFIIVEANAQARFAGTNVNRPNFFDFQIDETAGGDLDSNFYHRIGFAGSAAIANTWWPFAARRTYFKPAGTHTFRLEAIDQSIEGTKSVWNSMITATYFPASFGPVQSASSTGAPVPPNARLINVEGDNMANPGPTRQTYEFELKGIE